MVDRYSRQILALGEEGQKHLSTRSVLVIGAGGVGSPLLLYLAGAGIGTIDIIDHDVVDITNLHRQILFKEKNVGEYKAALAEKAANELNSNISIHGYTEKLNTHNAKHLFQNYDLIIDGSDNFQTRYLTNDICCQLGLPLVSASIYQSQIQILKINPTCACYRCVFPEPPPPTFIENCDLSGIIGATAGIAGSMAAFIVIQMLKDANKDLKSMLIRFDCDTYSINQIEVLRQTNCPSCVKKLISWPVLNYKVDINNININEYLVVDLRETNEDRRKILNVSQKHLPFSSFIHDPGQLPKIKILFYCTRGIRSDYAAHLMRGKGVEAWSFSIQ